jgi:hypothetical protein
MSKKALAALAKNRVLLDEFRKSPLTAIQKIVEATGVDLSRITYDEIKLMQNLTDEEFQMFVGVADRMTKLNIKNFKL